MKYITVNTVSGVLAFLGTLATAFGKPAMAQVFSDPNTVQAVTGIISAGAAIVATLTVPPHVETK